MNTIKKGSLVYIPADVKLFQEYPEEGSMIPKNFIITNKPVNCLVVGADQTNPVKKFNVIYKGTTWSVRAKDVYQVDKERRNDVSYISRSSGN